MHGRPLTLPDERRFTCAGCGVLSPVASADEGSSMITLLFGWRLRRNLDAGRVDARCPACDARFKATTPSPLPPPPSGRVARPLASSARDGVPVATRFRSTWLGSSLAALRERGLMDRYLGVLPEPYHAVVTS